MTTIYELLVDTQSMKRTGDLTDADVVELAIRAVAYAQRDLDAVNGPALPAITALVQRGHDLTCACRQVMRDLDCACGQWERDAEASH